MADLYSVSATLRFYVLASSEREAEDTAQNLCAAVNADLPLGVGELDFRARKIANQSYELKMHAVNFTLTPQDPTDG